ncbi:MAG: chorismate synthase [Bacteroidales bacterium]|nr:chorismate synthase [Bacteroidales bacterium]
MNTFGRNFRVEIFGESHGPAIGIVVDGIKAGMPLSKDDFMGDILRRKSGTKGTTPRIEADEPEILSGVFEGHTTGSPIAIIFRNTNTKSSDYKEFLDVPRPGHADWTAAVKWNGMNDPRGGGHFSGRLTLPLVAAGVIAKKQCGFSFNAELVEIGGEADKSKWESLLDETAKEGDSLGGIVECRVEGVPAGLGEPFFDSVESLISHAVFSIPGVRGIEFGDGFAASRMRGSEHNDALQPRRSEDELGRAQTALSPVAEKNGAGGVNGGITNGAPIVFRVAFKPTSSISKSQNTLNIKTGEMTDLKIKGRHDVCFALRTPVIVESVAAIVLAGLV